MLFRSFIANQSVPVEQIEQDLRLIKKYSSCVRTYGVSQGLEAVPAIAQKLAMKVKLGAWISRDAVGNQLELTTALSLAQRYVGTVDTLIVGNEVLLRKELSVNQLAALLDRARANTTVPVTYADVWEFWLRNPQLANHVDFVGIHILPFWEDHPVSREHAVNHVLTIAQRVQQAFPNKRVWVGETGWPSAGRQRGPAKPSVVEQTMFIWQMLGALEKQSEFKNLSINFIEAFDQPWKRHLEGAMGGYWGVLDANGEPKFSLSGAQREDSFWPQPVMFTMALTAFLGFIGGFFYGEKGKVLRGFFCSGCACAATGLIAMIAQYGVLWNRSATEWGLFLVAQGSVVFYSASLMVDKKIQVARQLLQTAALFCIAAQVLCLAFDARYRGFNTALLVVPVLFLLLHMMQRNKGTAPLIARSSDYFLLFVIATSSVAVLVQEGLQNTQALGFVTASLVLVGGLLFAFDAFKKAIPDNSSATDARSVQ